MSAISRARPLGLNPIAAAGVAVLVLALVLVPPVYGQYLPQRISDYLIFGLPALAVGLIAGQARLTPDSIDAPSVRPARSSRACR